MKVDGDASLTVALDQDAIQAGVDSIARGIAGWNRDLDRLVVAGIPTRGVALAKRVVDVLVRDYGLQPAFGSVDVSMHRDDLRTRGGMKVVQATDLPVDVDGRPVVLVDDVLFTGRSCRAAMDAVSSFGRPSRIGFAVLVDRGNRELPIQADFVGATVQTAPEQRIRVRLREVDEIDDCVWVVTP